MTIYGHNSLAVAALMGDRIALEEATQAQQDEDYVAGELAKQRSPKRSSTISTRTTARGVATVKQEPTEDELYSMPLEKLRAASVG